MIGHQRPASEFINCANVTEAKYLRLQKPTQAKGSEPDDNCKQQPWWCTPVNYMSGFFGEDGFFTFLAKNGCMRYCVF